MYLLLLFFLSQPWNVCFNCCYMINGRSVIWRQYLVECIAASLLLWCCQCQNHHSTNVLYYWFNSLSFVKIKRCFPVKRSWCAPLPYVPWWPGILLKGRGQRQCNDISLLLTSLPFWFDLQVGFDLQICCERLWPKHWLPSNRWNSKWGSMTHRAFPIVRIVLVFQVLPFLSNCLHLPLF